jgi:hypothetical protein
MLNMNVKFNQFIVCEKRDYSRFSARGKNDFTEPGVILYEIGSLVPVIIKGEGCLANAKISAITIRSTGTTVTFELTEIAKGTADAAYNLYRNGLNSNLNSGNSADIYEDAKDSVIPGVFSGKSKFDEDDDIAKFRSVGKRFR